jgi:hypothetical protein
MSAHSTRPQVGKSPGDGGALTVHLTIEPGDDLSGSASSDAGGPPIAFSGWLGLVETLNLLRRRAGHTTM